MLRARKPWPSSLRPQRRSVISNRSVTPYSAISSTSAAGAGIRGRRSVRRSASASKRLTSGSRSKSRRSSGSRSEQGWSSLNPSRSPSSGSRIRRDRAHSACPVRGQGRRGVCRPASGITKSMVEEHVLELIKRSTPSEGESSLHPEGEGGTPGGGGRGPAAGPQLHRNRAPPPRLVR